MEKYFLKGGVIQGNNCGWRERQAKRELEKYFLLVRVRFGNLRVRVR